MTWKAIGEIAEKMVEDAGAEREQAKQDAQLRTNSEPTPNQHRQRGGYTGGV